MARLTLTFELLEPPPPLRAGGEGWGGVKPITLATSHTHNPPLPPCAQGREQI
jgi:hypothetical protein